MQLRLPSGARSASLAGLGVLLAAGLIMILPSCAMLKTKEVAHWAEVNGHSLYYETGGNPAGSPILLLHGGGSSISGSFRRQLAALGKEHSIIAIEQVGQGHTPDVKGPLTYSGMTEDTAALLAQLKMSPVDAIGYSDGGIIALMLAVRHPEMVRRLVVSGANIDPSGLTADDIAEMQADEPIDEDNDDTPDDDKADTLEDGSHATPIGEKLRQLWLYSPTPDELTPELLHTIHQRTLVMAGEHDAIRREHTMMIYHALPDAKVWILPNTGHATFSERARWVNPAVLAFLDAP